jgi:hypothetical protein
LGDAEEHMKKPKKRLSKLEKSSNYAKACAAGMAKPATNSKKLWQAHHILSITCMAKRKADYPDDKDTKKYIEDCLYCANWDINAEPNLLGMPLNLHHRRTEGIVPIPSHQVDHNTAGGYTKDVSKWLQKNVWSTLQAKKQIHKVDVKKIEDQLKGCSTWFLGLLTVDHPSRDLGTFLSWKHRFDRLDSWFEPFSMAITPNPRRPGKSPTNFKELFKKIK